MTDTLIREKLFKYRTQECKKRFMPPYCVFTNKIIDLLIEEKPTTTQKLISMKGWWPYTIENYGDDVIAILLTPEAEIPQGKTVEIVPGIENHGKIWEVEDDIQLLELFVSEYYPVEISTEINRTEGSIRCRIQQHIEDTLPQERKDELDQYELDEVKSVLLTELLVLSHPPGHAYISL